MRRIALSAVLGGTLMAGFAQAQPSSYYGFRGGDPPPRPPAAVPNDGMPPQQQYQPQQYPPQYPPPPQYPGQYPTQSIPPPAAGGPAPSAIQGQPLPPPGGVPPTGGAPLPPGARAHAAPGTPGAGPAPPDVQPPAAVPPPDDTVVTEMPTAKIENTRAVFAGLDKITGRIISFDAAIGETVQFGALRVTARVCYTRPPTEATNTDAFVDVDEVTLQGEIKRIFNGWMFAASPGLHGVEHPIYDVWLTDCAAPTKVAEPVLQPTTAAAAPAPARQPAPKPKPPRPPAPPPLAPAPAGQLPPPQVR
jgi:hypothetical protein